MSNRTATAADLAAVIDPGRLYSPAELEALGVLKAATGAAYRYRTKVTGRLHGPRWVKLGDRVAHPGAAVIEWVLGSGKAEAA